MSDDAKAEAIDALAALVRDCEDQEAIDRLLLAASGHDRDLLLKERDPHEIGSLAFQLRAVASRGVPDDAHGELWEPERWREALMRISDGESDPRGIALLALLPPADSDARVLEVRGVPDDREAAVTAGIEAANKLRWHYATAPNDDGAEAERESELRVAIHAALAARALRVPDEKDER